MTRSREGGEERLEVAECGRYIVRLKGAVCVKRGKGGLGWGWGERVLPHW